MHNNADNLKLSFNALDVVTDMADINARDLYKLGVKSDHRDDYIEAYEARA